MNKTEVNRRNDIDFLKAICIIVVVFYHMGCLESGYLGVDAFFVINGFLVIPSTINNILCFKKFPTTNMYYFYM